MSTQNRRDFLKRISGVGIAASLSGCYYPFRAARHRRRKRIKRAIAGNPISFASHTERITKSMATHVVTTRSQLISALSVPNAIVWIPGNVVIDMTGGFMIPIAANVTLASNRNLNGGKGGLIKTNGYDDPLFIHEEGSLRITGIRAEGPRMDYFDPWDWGADHEDYTARAFNCIGDAIIIDNCEMFGWTFAAFTPGTRDIVTNGWIHHNSFHHCQMAHLGYATDLFNGEHLFEWNYFAKYRHAIAGYGYKTNAYEARYNVVGLPGAAEYGFAFDMHSLGEQPNFPDHVTTAGKYVNAHHNVFELSEHNAMSVSGIPVLHARFVNNWCATSKGGDGPGVPALSITSEADVRKHSNQFGADAVQRGRAWLQKKAAQQTTEKEENTTNTSTDSGR